jgi:hypothetical protein
VAQPPPGHGEPSSAPESPTPPAQHGEPSSAPAPRPKVSSEEQQTPPTSVTISASEPLDSDHAPAKFEVKLGKESPWKDRIAAIGIAATLIASLAGIAATWIAGTRHDARQLQQAQASFTQAQQRDAYAAFYSAVNEFVEAVWAEERQWEPFDNRTAVNRLAAPMKENLGASTNNVLTAESKVTFCGSEQTQKTADEVVQQVLSIQMRLMGFEYAHPQYPNLSDAEAAEFRNVAREIHDLMYKDLQGAQAKFRDAARKDLGYAPLAGDTHNPLYGNPPGTPVPASATVIPSQPPR